MTTPKQLIKEFENCDVKEGTAKFHRFHVKQHCRMRASKLLTTDEDNEVDTTMDHFLEQINKRLPKIVNKRKYQVSASASTFVFSVLTGTPFSSTN